MKFKKIQKAALSAAMGFALMFGVFTTQTEAGTGFVPNSFSQNSPFSVTASTHDMFSFNYNFTSGSDWRTDLGHPTTFNGAVDINVFNANVRSDKNVALLPPQYGVFSGEFMTMPTNSFFSRPVNPNFWLVNLPQSPDGLPAFDTLLQGINSQQSVLGQQGQISINPSGTAGFLPPTSIQ